MRINVTKVRGHTHHQLISDANTPTQTTPYVTLVISTLVLLTTGDADEVRWNLNEIPSYPYEFLASQKTNTKETTTISTLHTTPKNCPRCNPTSHPGQR